MSQSPRGVLTIAGSDPSGGAGVQADLRVFAALGVAGVSALSALTVQNSRGVRAVYPVPAAVLTEQIDAILEDSDVRAVKIGMLAGAEQVHAVVEALRRFRPRNIVLDPVLASTGGVPLLDEAGRGALLTDLLPLCDVVTPNIMELAALTGMPVDLATDRILAASELLECGVKAILVKGGHLSAAPLDLLLEPGAEPMRMEGARIETAHTHGTGCFLSAAIAASLASGKSVRGSARLAKELITAALAEPVILGEGRGYPDIFAGIRRLDMERGSAGIAHHQRIRKLEGSLYLVTDSELRPDRSVEAIAKSALAGGVKVIQLRDKRLPDLELIALARRLRAMTHAAGALLIVNDRVDIALAADADGVHLGPDDIHPDDARRILGSEKLIGVSVGTVEEARALRPYVSYFGVGAIFGSKTKSDAGEPIGTDRIREIRAAFAPAGSVPCPIVAIGGINLGNIASVAEAGAAAAAVVSAVVCASDMREASEELLARFVAVRTAT